MNLASALLLSLWLSITPLAQEGSKSRAAIEGLVTKDPDSQPVKKVLIELIAENQSEAGDYTAITSPDGTFRIESVVPGRYHLFAERTGFLDSEKQHGRTDGRILTLTPGQELKDVHIRLQAAAVVRGRITDEDGEPMANAEVTVLRSTFVAGRNRWEAAGADLSNDLGEYRIANLPAGNFYVSVNPPPDFKSLIDNSSRGPAEPRSPNAPEKPASTYQTSFYPGTSDRSQATPIQLHAGDDFPVNFSLMPGPSLSIRGKVINLPPRMSANIMLQSRDFNVALNGSEMQKDGSFVIRDVSPGNYTIVASVDGSQPPLTARQVVQVGSTNVDGLRLAPQPGAGIRGHLRVEGKSSGRFDPEQVFLSLHSLDGADDERGIAVGENFTNLAHVKGDGSFEWNDIPAGNYYVELIGDRGGANEDWFLKSVLQSGREANDSGISVSGGMVTLDVVASESGGVVDGVAANRKGETVANAVVVAVPETRLRGRVDRYAQTVSDQTGHFTLRGLAPGGYTVYAWESVDGEAYYSPEFLKGFDGRGISLHLSEGERKSVQIAAISEEE